jgi:hypothetical protein
MKTVVLVKPENAVLKFATPKKAQHAGISMAGMILSKNSNAITSKKNIVITENFFTVSVYSSFEGIISKIKGISMVMIHFISDTLFTLAP